jgi:hypothetical protein
VNQEPLASLARRIQDRQEAAIRAGKLPAAEARALELAWQELDRLAAELYQLSRRERKLLETEPRRSSRSELLLRHLKLRHGRLSAPEGMSHCRRHVDG